MVPALNQAFYGPTRATLRSTNGAGNLHIWTFLWTLQRLLSTDFSRTIVVEGNGQNKDKVLRPFSETCGVGRKQLRPAEVRAGIW
jgi:hypothetical protein